MKKPELLAPAGNMAAALAAFDAGADAVYAGLAKFNARERGENFTPESMAQLIAYAHRLGRKVYLAVNTIVKETELAELAELLGLLRNLEPDALIVQDLGVVEMVKRYFPELPLHASTQMGFHNSAGVLLAEAMGFERVILERQITLEELREIRRKTKIELEVFVHGALCCSLSGQCLFSSFLGGSSGNRGKCRQPCRRRYYAAEGNGFFCSPHDLAAPERIRELAELGISSFKIEGRLRQPDYVSLVTGCYRTMIDEEKPDLGDVRRRLGKACGRKWSDGFFTSESAASLIEHRSMGAAGLLIGQVETLRDNGFGFTARKRLHVGDRIRMQDPSSEEGPSLTVTRLFVEGQSAAKVSPGETAFICCDKPVAPKSLIFKIGESFADYTARIAALPPPGKRVDLEISLDRDRISVRSPNTTLPDWSRALDLAPAAKHPLDAAGLAAEFAQADSVDYRAAVTKCDIAGEWFFPASERKTVRREFWEFAKANLANAGWLDPAAPALEQFRRDYLTAPVETAPNPATETVAVVPGGAEPASRQAVRATSVFDLGKFCSEAILPEFCPEDKLDSLRRAVERAWDAGIRRFRVTGLYGFELLKPYPEAEIMVSAPVPVANSLCVSALKNLGAKRVMAHIELERGAIEALRDHAPLPLEIYRLGRPPLLVTRATLPVEGEFRDNRNNRFIARFDRKSRLTRIYPRATMSIPRIPGTYDYYDLGFANWNATELTTFNFDGGLS